MRRFVTLFGLVCLLLVPGRSDGHPISISDAYVEVQPDALEVRLEVFVEDLYLFHDLELNEQNALPLDQVAEGAKRHVDFLKERFKILTADGTPLQAELQQVDEDDLPDHAIPFAHLMFFRLVYEFRYSLEEPAEYLTFLQDFTPDDAVVPSEVMVKIKPLEGRRLQNTLLPNSPWTVRLENETPDADGEKSETSQDRAERLRRETLGITSYGQTYAFLYLEPEQTRLELLVPLATLAGSLEQPLEPDGRLEVEDQQALKAPLEAIARRQLQITLNGKPTEPKVERIQIFGLALKDFSQNTDPQPVSVASARVGIILSYPPAASGELTWNLFNEYLYQTRLAVIRGDETSRVDLRQVDDENVYRWSEPEEATAASNNEAALERLHVDVPPPDYTQEISLAVVLLAVVLVLLVPVGKRPAALLIVSLLLVAGFFGTQLTASGPTRLLKEPPPEVLTPLLGQVYAAFNQREEEQVYDQLDAVVDGPMLRELYLEIRRSMAVEEQGGAIARAGHLTLLECEPITDAELSEHAERFRCRWQVEGTVEHWGHIHSRTTTYLANLTIAPRPADEQSDRWKLTAVDLLNQQQSVLETDVRQF